MPLEKPTDQIGGLIDPANMPGLGADRTTEEVVADIVNADPKKHGVTLEERKRRMIEEAKRVAEETRKFFEEPEEDEKL
jgi:hypothetical protein